MSEPPFTPGLLSAARTFTAPDASGPTLSPTHDAEARLRAILFNSGAAAAWEWQVDRRVVIGDAGFAALYGIDPAHAAAGVTAATFFSIIHPLDRDRIRLAIGGMLRGVEVLSKEYRVLTPAGALRWLHLRGRGQPSDSAAPARFGGVLVDITEQKRLEEQLRIAQTAGGVGTFEHIDGFGTVSVSTQFCRLLGLHPTTNLPVRTVNAVVHPGDPPIIDLAAPRTAGVTGQAEFRVVRPGNGETRWFMRRAEHLRDGDDSGLRFSGVIYDITDAKRVEEQLRTLNDTLETRVAERTRERDRIWRVSRDLLGVADPAGRWISVNPAWHALLGWKESEVVGRTLEWLQHPQDKMSFAAELAASLAGQHRHTFENRLRQRQNGYLWLSWTAVPEDGLLYCVGRDITAEKEAAAALVAAEEQLRQSQKMEAVGQLTGGLAHDFNNLLTGIAGSLELLQARIARGDTGNLERYIEAAEGSCKRAAALTHRLLAFSRRQTLTPRPIDVSNLVASMEDLIRHTMGPRVILELCEEDGLWNTTADPNQLENALLNLCINARDAMPDGGRLVIGLANRALHGQEAADRHLPAGDYVALAVTDTGTGMAPEVVARAFDPFFTTKPTGLGTGLGLSMVYGFARQSGGQAGIRSEVGHGTTISIYLPRHHGSAKHIEEVLGTTTSPRSGRGKRVLVVDDEPIIRMLVTEILTDLGYETLEAASGDAALDILRSVTGPDLLVSDVGLPGSLNGRQLADAARMLHPGLKVLFITGYAKEATLSNLEPGMQVVSKPFEMEALARRIQSIIFEA